MSKEEKKIIDYAIVVALVILAIALMRARIERLFDEVPEPENLSKPAVLHIA